MANRPCLTCGQPSPDSYCDNHSRQPNLARDHLETIANRDRWICRLCLRAVTHRGRDTEAASLDHLDGDVANNHPTNLRLAHNGCNARRHSAGWTV